MNTEALTKEMIEAQIAELEKQKENLYTVEKYLKIVEDYNEDIKKYKNLINHNNKSRREIYGAIISAGGEEFVELTSKEIPLHSKVRKSYYERESWNKDAILVKEKDFNTEVIEEVTLKVNNKPVTDWKYNTPKNEYSILASDVNWNWQHRYMKTSSIVKKLKEEREKNNKNLELRQKLEKVCEELKNEFTLKYPEATVASGRIYHKGVWDKIGRDLDIIEIKFPNGNYVQVLYSENKTWRIHATYKTPPAVPPTKEEIIEGLR